MNWKRYFLGLEVFSLFALVLSGLAIAYLLSPSYMEYANVEPLVAVGAQQWLHGYPLYTSASGPNFYSTVYGPATYLYTAFGLVLFKDPILGSKFSSVVLCIVTLLVFTWAAKRTLRWSETLFALGLFSIQSLFLPEFCFGIAVNPGLTFATVLGLLSTTFSHWNVRLGLLAFATGLALCTKLHGPIYLLPAWIIFFYEGGWQKSLWCGLISVEIFLLPFFLNGVSLRNQIDLLIMLNHHPRQWGMFVGTVATELLLAWPVLILLAVPKHRGLWSLEGRVRQIAMGLFLGFLLVLVPATKEGSGAHHLWPFIPWISYVIALWLQSAETRTTSTLRMQVIRSCLMIWIFFQAVDAYREIGGVTEFLKDGSRRALVDEDIKSILLRYPNNPLQMGYGSDRSFTLTYYRPLLYARQTPCLIDGTAAMDFAEAGYSLKPACHAMLVRKDDLWLIPKNEAPFTITSWYEPHSRLFDKALGDEFLSHFHKVASSSYFDIYGYRTR